MTIDEAIRRNGGIVKQLPVTLAEKEKQAIKLGIEALGQIKQIRAYAKELYLPLLPGETKE